MGKRQHPTVRYGESGRSRRSLRPGHAFIGISREPRRSRYLFGKLGVGSAHAKEPAILPSQEGRPGGSEEPSTEVSGRQGNVDGPPRVVEKSYEPMVPVKVGNPRAPARGGQGTHWRDGANRWTE